MRNKVIINDIIIDIIIILKYIGIKILLGLGNRANIRQY